MIFKENKMKCNDNAFDNKHYKISSNCMFFLPFFPKDYHCNIVTFLDYFIAFYYSDFLFNILWKRSHLTLKTAEWFVFNVDSMWHLFKTTENLQNNVAILATFAKNCLLSFSWIQWIFARLNLHIIHYAIFYFLPNYIN